MDLYRDEDHVYVKIVDYKSGTISFDLVALFYGLQLQLVVCMDAVVEIEERRYPDKEVVPVGIFYYHIGGPITGKQEGMGERDIEKQILKQFRMNDLVNDELGIIRHLDREIGKESGVIPVAIKDGYTQEGRSSVASTRHFRDLHRFANRKFREAGQDTLMGSADLKPYKQGNGIICGYCLYHAVCGFDTKAAGYGYREFEGLRPGEIRAELESGGDGETDGSGLDQ